MGNSKAEKETAMETKIKESQTDPIMIFAALRDAAAHVEMCPLLPDGTTGDAAHPRIGSQLSDDTWEAHLTFPGLGHLQPKPDPDPLDFIPDESFYISHGTVRLAAMRNDIDELSPHPVAIFNLPGLRPLAGGAFIQAIGRAGENFIAEIGRHQPDSTPGTMP